MVPPTYPPELATTGLLGSEDTQGQLVCLPAVSSGDPSSGGGEHPWPRPACLGKTCTWAADDDGLWPEKLVRVGTNPI